MKTNLKFYCASRLQSSGPLLVFIYFSPTKNSAKSTADVEILRAKCAASLLKRGKFIGKIRSNLYGRYA